MFSTLTVCILIYCSLIGRLSANQRALLCHVIRVLQHISRHSEVNKMTSSNLGVCLAPSMLWPEPDEAAALGSSSGSAALRSWLRGGQKPAQKLVMSADGEEFKEAAVVIERLIVMADELFDDFDWSATVYDNFLAPLSMHHSKSASSLDDSDAVTGMHVACRCCYQLDDLSV